MKKYISIIAALAVAGTTMTSCKKEGCTDSLATNYDPDAKKDNGTCVYEDPTPDPPKKYALTFNFTHNYDGTAVTSSDFNNLSYINQFGNTHSISKLKYLISDIRLYKSDGDSVILNGYNLIDLTNSSSLTYAASSDVEEGTYTGIAFIFGFDNADNDGNYPDLNLASWNWPGMLGGGYHYMQFEGKYIDTNTDTIGFGYHMGTARKIAGTDTTYENNHFKADLANSGFTLSNNATVEIKMNIAEWFKNPNTWDLNQYDQMLMPNYTAQIMMNDNGKSVFSLGAITQ